MSIEKIKEVLSSKDCIIGFLTNLGLVTITFILYLIIKDLISLENLTDLWKVNIFSIIYIALYILADKGILIENIKFKAGFDLAGIITAILIVKEYLIIFFS